jgi:hypothetical protein
VTGIEPELWVDRGAEAVTFYQAAFGATVLHRAGDGEDVVDQLAIGVAAFWVSTAGSAGQRIHPKAIGGATSRTLLIVDDPEAVFWIAPGILEALITGRMQGHGGTEEVPRGAARARGEDDGSPRESWRL